MRHAVRFVPDDGEARGMVTAAIPVRTAGDPADHSVDLQVDGGRRAGQVIPDDQL